MLKEVKIDLYKTGFIKRVVMISNFAAYKFKDRNIMQRGETMSQQVNTSMVQEFGTKQERCVSLGKYIVDNGATVRSAAKVFGISKSTVHQDITSRLEKVNPTLQKQVKEVLEKNKQERHIRGGMATKKKYSELREQEK